MKQQLKTHAYLFQAEDEGEIETSRMSVPAAASSLLLVTVITSFCADYRTFFIVPSSICATMLNMNKPVVASIEEFAERYHIPKAFIGLVLIPIVANAAEHVTSVWMAMKNKMELTIGICVGSSIQIAAFVVPLLVVIGWM
jgi:Ca2+:H+ antiporter